MGRWLRAGCGLGDGENGSGANKWLKIKNGFPSWNDRILLLFSVEMNFFVRMV